MLILVPLGFAALYAYDKYKAGQATVAQGGAAVATASAVTTPVPEATPDQPGLPRQVNQGPGTAYSLPPPQQRAPRADTQRAKEDAALKGAADKALLSDKFFHLASGKP